MNVLANSSGYKRAAQTGGLGNNRRLLLTFLEAGVRDQVSAGLVPSGIHEEESIPHLSPGFW